MSSILDALEKLERVRPDGTPAGRSPSPQPPRRRRGPGLLAGGIAVVAAALAFAILRSPGPEGTPVQAASPVAEGTPETPIDPAGGVASPTEAPAPPPADDTAAAAPPAPPSPSPAEAAQPPPEPAAIPSTPDAPPAPPAAAAQTPAPADGARPVLAAAPPIPPPTDTDARPWGKPVQPAPPVVRVPPVPPLAAAPQPRELDAPPPVRRAPAGAPKVQLSFLLFSGSAERRSVALSIDGSGLETLREGETSGGLEVVRILPDRVDLRWEGQPFTVRARD